MIEIQNEKTLDMIQYDGELPCGLYLKEKDDQIWLYEKYKKDMGYVMSNILPFIKELGVFSISEYEDNSQTITHSVRTTIKPKLRKSDKSPSQSPQTYLSVLTEIFNSDDGCSITPSNIKKLEIMVTKEEYRSKLIILVFGISLVLMNIFAGMVLS